MKYDELLADLNEAKDQTDAFALFQKRLLCTNKQVLGVRTPAMRKIAKKYTYDELKGAPSDVYEASFVRICTANSLPYERLKEELFDLVAEMDTWALTDTFKPKSVEKNKKDFLFSIEALLCDQREFFQRFALVTLLNFYVEEEYLPVVFESLLKADNEKYYVHMASAWLTAEVLVKHYERGKNFLAKNQLDKKTHNKAIRKALESFRLTAEQKNELKRYKR